MVTEDIEDATHYRRYPEVRDSAYVCRRVDLISKKQLRIVCAGVCGPSENEFFRVNDDLLTKVNTSS